MTAKDKIQTSIQRAVRLEEVPAERFGVMVSRTVLGTLLVGLGVYIIAPRPEGMTLYVGVGLVLLGATTWSTQIVTGSIKALLGPVAHFKKVIGGPE